MASRFFLTLLALLTGLAAQVSPAQARDCARTTSVVSTLASPGTRRPSPVPAGLARLPAPGLRTTRLVAEPIAAPASGYRPFAVRPGIDRAHE
ncbi:hypothetical protein B2G71_14800 [Novosphingobium sp. PC22D]|nr:hypothetical protein B2G71_14800 [Novosphingobium sp. PC22D]